MNTLKEPVNPIALKRKLINAEQLLDEVWSPESKPSLRWLRTQTKLKTIPVVRIGHLCFFDAGAVRAKLGMQK